MLCKLFEDAIKIAYRSAKEDWDEARLDEALKEWGSNARLQFEHKQR